jgi:DNA-binding transcriptional ArsR family regulator
VFAALGDETRLRLVARLCEGGPASIARLTARSKITRQAIAKHLRVMEKSGLVRCTRQGREAIWQLEQPGIEEARRYLDGVSARWDDALLRLRKFVC